ncbi:MAG TPA: acetoacetate decarboxylase family protein, partial [Acidimicrobiia bacterium]|nr:acetoacetate decarboxylase family protein [Acidimicrobiia bacterium]
AERPGFVNSHPMLHSRWWPAIESDGSDALDELVTMSGYGGEVGDIWSGTAEVDLSESPSEELSLLHPIEIVAGYYHRVGVSWGGGTTLRRTFPMEVEGI